VPGSCERTPAALRKHSLFNQSSTATVDVRSVCYTTRTLRSPRTDQHLRLLVQAISHASLFSTVQHVMKPHGIRAHDTMTAALVHPPPHPDTIKSLIADSAKGIPDHCVACCVNAAEPKMTKHLRLTGPGHHFQEMNPLPSVNLRAGHAGPGATALSVLRSLCQVRQVVSFSCSTATAGEIHPSPRKRTIYVAHFELWWPCCLRLQGLRRGTLVGPSTTRRFCCFLLCATRYMRTCRDYRILTCTVLSVLSFLKGRSFVGAVRADRVMALGLPTRNYF